MLQKRLVNGSSFYIINFSSIILFTNKDNKKQKILSIKHFATTNKSFQFIYSINNYIIENVKFLRIEINPVIGFIKPPRSTLNGCDSIIVTFFNNKTYEIYNSFVEMVEKRMIKVKNNSFRVDYFVVLPKECIDNKDIEIIITSNWRFNGEAIEENLRLNKFFNLLTNAD